MKVFASNARDEQHYCDQANKIMLDYQNTVSHHQSRIVHALCDIDRWQLVETHCVHQSVVVSCFWAVSTITSRLIEDCNFIDHTNTAQYTFCMFSCYDHRNKKLSKDTIYTSFFYSMKTVSTQRLLRLVHSHRRLTTMIAFIISKNLISCKPQ